MADPQYIKDPENFHSDRWDHARIVNAVANMDGNHIDDVARAWAELGSAASESIVAFSDAVKKQISASWQGAAASAAYAETERYATSAPEAREQLHGVAGALTPLIDTVTALGDRVPQTVGTGLWDKLTPWDTDTEDEVYRREDEARDAMATVYNPGLATSDGSVPEFTKPESRVDVPAGPSGPGVDQVNSAPSSSDRIGGPNAGQPNSGDAPASDPSAVDSAPTVDGTEQNATTAPSAATAPPTTAPASVTGDQAQSRTGMPQGTDSSSGGGSRSGGVGGGGSGGGIGVGAGGLGGGSAGGGRPGAGTGAGGKPGVAGMAAGGRSGTGMRGTGPMGGGMMGGGAGGAKGAGEDKEHKTPDYLITLDNGNELIGKLPLVSPPVIGA
ncbi:hypothetical protein [Rhodococcus tibetensis]|uniref:Proteins of 100 residues with WXG n=1 Tax=Rhodococcus tibetensis TaxID=2965064 RepID=A0ABT1Q5S6_9NOCA|nr:hypothetical protein [Rhodococcus sp. FXJ9.536]MCQ4117603.1 hypothetical protein [Rhodococcus sp. FXJ9.536]